MINTLKPIKTGLCAYGMSGRVFHAPFLQNLPGFELTAVTERHQKKAKRTYAHIKEYATVDALLADKEIELVVVNTPNITHYNYAKQALLHHKHVVVEKPFTVTTKQAEELIHLAIKQQRLLVAFQNRRWDSDFQSVQQVVEKGVLGKLTEAEFHFDRYKTTLNVKKHKEQLVAGVGLLYDLGPHLIDQAQVLFGKPQAVFARIDAYRPHSVVDDYFLVQLLYSHFTCTLKGSLLVREPLPAYVLHGTQGSYIKTRADVQEADLDQGKQPTTLYWGEEPKGEEGVLHFMKAGNAIRQEITAPKGDYAAFYKALYQTIRKGAPSPVPVIDSLYNTQIIEAAIASAKTNQVVKLE